MVLHHEEEEYTSPWQIGFKPINKVYVGIFKVNGIFYSNVYLYDFS